MKLFEIGDRVIGYGIQSNVDITGLVGTIVRNEYAATYDYAVEFDELVECIPTAGGDTTHFHDCAGEAEDGHGWFCDEKNLEPYEPSPTWNMEGLCLSALLE